MITYNSNSDHHAQMLYKNISEVKADSVIFI